MQNRRDFLKTGIVAGTAIGLSTQSLVSQSEQPARKPLETVKVGFVGIGVKGSSHLGILMHMEGVEIKAVCDIVEDQCKEAQAQAMRLGKPVPTAYHRGEWDFVRMCEEEELDLVYTATPWRWHTPVCVAAMENGKHAATEIPAAYTLDDCWKLVETSEKTGKHCVMMENVNYMPKEMAMWRMVREGLFGELQHAEAGYCHDTRYLKIKDTGDGLWLGDHHSTRNGNLYPCHAFGPAAMYLDVNCGDRLDYLVSMSCNARGMDIYVTEHLPEGHPKRERKYINGDVNTSLIKTVSGKSIVIKHDTDLPRPYSRINLLQGTRGIMRGYPEFKACFEKDVDESMVNNAYRHQFTWENATPYAEKYEHPLWNFLKESNVNEPKSKEFGRIGKNTVWHYNPTTESKGGDFLENYRLIQALLQDSPTDYNVYDAATWSAVSPLSEWSVANRSRPIDFPDFSKGRWKTKSPRKIMGV